MTLKKAMDTLRTKAAELNKLTDEAAVSVRLVEKFLNEECSAGIIAYVETHYEKMTLGYNRYNGSFRIVVKAGDDEKPWNEQNRTVKLNTVASLPRLVAAVAEETGRLLKRYEQSVATTKEILESIFKKG